MKDPNAANRLTANGTHSSRMLVSAASPFSDGKLLRRVHLIVGVTFVVGFLLTGQYMDRFLGHLHDLPDGQRMLYRSRHIYLLWSALLNLALGLHLRLPAARVRRILAAVGSAMILVGPFVLIVAFFIEPPLHGLPRSLTGPAVYLGFVGSLLQALATARTFTPS